MRGDVDHDGRLGISDAIFSLSEWPAVPCLDSGDANDDGKLNNLDVLAILLHLFDSGPALPPPNEGCGRDPTPDSLECWYSPLCGSEGVLTFEIAPGLRLYSIWGENRSTVEEQHSVLSVVELKPGLHDVSLEGDTPGITLVESLHFGPELAPAIPSGEGHVTYHPDGFPFPLEYRQSFLLEEGELVFVLNLSPTDERPVIVDCTYLEGQPQFWNKASYAAELDTGERRTYIFYSCFHPERWKAWVAKSITAVLDDGTTVTFGLEQCGLCYGGVFGHTSNYRMTEATIDHAGERFTVRGHENLIYAALHHNQKPQFRAIFDREREGVQGIDILSCPCDSPPGFLCPCSAEAHYLDSGLEPIRTVGAVLTWELNWGPP